MIWQLLFGPLIALINLIFSFIPSIPSVSNDLSVLIYYLKFGLYFTNSSVFATCIATYVTTETAFLGWNIVKFIYGKIPVINIH